MKWIVVLALAAACGVPDPAPVRRAPPPPAPSTAPAPAPAGAPGFVGVIAAADSVDLAPRFAGVIAAVHVRAGDAVLAGQVVAELDPRSVQEELRAAEAAYGAAAAAKRQADVDVEDARRKLALEQRGFTDGLSSQAALDEARLAVDRARAAAARAAASVAAEASHVQTARDHVADTALRAPTSGTVAMRFVDPGATVAAGAPIVRLVGDGGLRLRFAVPPDAAAHLAPGAVVHATIDTVTAPVAATVRQVAPALDPASGMIIVEAELVDAPAVVRPGLAAWVR